MNTQEHKCRIDSKFETSLDTQRQQKNYHTKKSQRNNFIMDQSDLRTHRKNDI